MWSMSKINVIFFVDFNNLVKLLNLIFILSSVVPTICAVIKNFAVFS